MIHFGGLYLVSFINFDELRDLSILKEVFFFIFIFLLNTFAKILSKFNFDIFIPPTFKIEL